MHYFKANDGRKAFVSLYPLTCAPKKLPSAFLFMIAPKVIKMIGLVLTIPRDGQPTEHNLPLFPSQFRADCLLQEIWTNQLWVVYEPYQLICTYVDFSGIHVHSFDQFLRGFQTLEKDSIQILNQEKLPRISSSSQ